MRSFVPAILASVAGVLALAFVLQGFGLFSLSFWGPKYEEANRKIVQQSIRRQEGVSEGIAALCLNMRLAENYSDQQKAFANLIVTQAGATGTELSADALACKAEAERVLGI